MKVIKNGYPWCSRWYIEIDESAYCSSTGMDYSELTRVYVYPDCSHDCDIIKCLKKAWKHYNKLAYQKMKEHDFRIEVRVNAYIESEYGDVEDISWFWLCEQMEYEEEKGVCFEFDDVQTEASLDMPCDITGYCESHCPRYHVCDMKN